MYAIVYYFCGNLQEAVGVWIIPGIEGDGGTIKFTLPVSYQYAQWETIVGRGGSGWEIGALVDDDERIILFHTAGTDGWV